MHETPPTPLSRRRQAMTQRIIDAATEIVIAGGFDSLSVQRLATALDYTPGALYRYFPSKDALLSAVVVGIIEDVGAMLRKLAIATAADAPLDRLRALALGWGAFAKESPNRFVLIQVLMAAPQVILTDPALAAPAIGAMFKAIEPVQVALRDAATDGSIAPGDATRRALVLFAGLQGALMLRKQTRHIAGILAPDLLFKDVLETLIAGWAAIQAPGARVTANARKV